MGTDVNTEKIEAATATQTELDGLVASIELTLISIIQGVALSFLISSAAPVLVELRFSHWPYVGTGLLITLIFWSRSLLYTLTVIRYPFELWHNYMYFVTTFVKSVLLTQVANAAAWYAVSALFALTICLQIAFDIRVISRRMADSPGPIGARLYELTMREHKFTSVMLMPLMLLFNLAAALAISRWPKLFIEQHGHVVLALLQLISAAAILIHSARFFTRITPLIRRTRQEWRDDVLT